MKSINLTAQVGEDGILHLDVPLGMNNTQIEVTVTVKSVTPTLQGKGWPTDFFEQTYGSCQDDPIVIDSEDVFEQREEIC